MRRAVLLAVLALLAAGCVTPTNTDDADGERVATAARGPFVDPIDDGHDHGDPALHNLSTPTMERYAFDSLGDDAARFTGFGEMDLFGDLAVVSAVHLGDQRLGAVVMVDLSDPSDPKRLGFATIGDASHPLDVKFDEAGEFVYASATGQIYAVDVRDPANPVLAGAMLPTGMACHMSALGVVDGVEYFFCTGDLVGLTVYRVVSEASAGRALVPVAYVKSDDAPATSGSATWAMGAPHDMTFQHDPVDGRPILVVANRGQGVRVLDLTDPTMPKQLGKWHGDGAEKFSNHLHTSMVTMIDGVRYLIVSPEILAAETPAAVWVLDATDYAALTLKAEWWAPGDHVSPGFTFTTHQWQVADGRLYLGFYHAGVWVLDLRAILAGAHRADPDRSDVLGYHLPNEAPVEEGAMVPNVWDVTLRNGLMFVTDISSGLYVLRYTADAVGDEAITGFS